MSAAPFTLAGRFRLVRVLGEGGMGRVWAAQDLLLGREVAVKEMLPPGGLSPRDVDRLRERVLREARAIARVDHPNVVRVIDVLHERGEPWIVMELIPSRSLFDVVREDGPMPPRRVAEIGLAVLSALRAAHAAGLLHRDVKPANVLLGFDGRVVLTDFGLALLSGDSSMTATGAVVGSPSFLAPERILDQPIGPSADLWSLGATLYAAVEGRPPYSKSSPIATLAAVAGEEPPRPPVRAGALGPVLEGLLHKDPAHRADAATAERMLRAVAAGTTPARAHVRRSSSGRRWLPVLAAVLTAVVVLGVGAGFVLRSRTQPAADTSAALLPVSEAPAVVSEPSAPPTGPAPAEEPTVPSSPAPAAPEQQSARPGKTTKPPAAATGIDAKTWYRLVNLKTDKCVDVRGGVPDEHTPVQQLTCGTAKGQHFQLLPTSDGFLRIASRLDTLKSLDVVEQAPNDFAKIQLWPYNGRQQWRAVAENGGHYHFVNKFSDKCLDIPNGDAAEELQLDQFSCNGTGAQSFRLEKASPN
ncbi:protein kinase [Actinoplanes sp. NPDC049265]|uniref:serine/threonine protein kinase n=1 Tax=Actinoplanes sp. NPDC049265 TaxID=3363902 RepID=UPI0037121CF6